MTAATALTTAKEASPELAVAAVNEALAQLRLTHAGSVLLFLSPEFSRLAAPTLRAVSRAAQCLQVAGAITAGVVTEKRWSFDGPAAAAMVLAGGAGMDTAHGTSEPQLSLCAESRLPSDWPQGPPRFGARFDDSLNPDCAQVFAQGRLCQPRIASLAFANTRVHVAAAPGQHRISPWLRVDAAHGFDLLRIAGCRAADSVRRHLPPPWRSQNELPPGLSLQIAATADSAADPAIGARSLPVAGISAEGHVTLCEVLAPGARVAWTLRQPLAAEREVQALLDDLIARCPQPAFGLFFSCIGRGPYLYEGEDRDWHSLRTRVPGLPFIGAYGNAQLCARDGTNQTLHNAVVISLCETRLGD